MNGGWIINKYICGLRTKWGIELWFQHNKMVKYESSDNIFYENLM